MNEEKNNDLHKVKVERRNLAGCNGRHGGLSTRRVLGLGARWLPS